jgi:hypothetical protein
MTIHHVPPRAAHRALSGMTGMNGLVPLTDASGDAGAQSATPSCGCGSGTAPFPDGSYAYPGAYGPQYSAPPPNTMAMVPSSAATESMPGDMIVLVPSPGEYQDCGGPSFLDILIYGFIGYNIYRLLQDL